MKRAPRLKKLNAAVARLGGVGVVAVELGWDRTWLYRVLRAERTLPLERARLLSRLTGVPLRALPFRERRWGAVVVNRVEEHDR